MSSEHGGGASPRPTDLSYNLRERNVSWGHSETDFKTEDAIRYVKVKGHRLHRLYMRNVVNCLNGCIYKVKMNRKVRNSAREKENLKKTSVICYLLACYVLVCVRCRLGGVCTVERGFGTWKNLALSPMNGLLRTVESTLQGARKNINFA